jgi:hypothetical protein
LRYFIILIFCLILIGCNNKSNNKETQSKPSQSSNNVVKKLNLPSIELWDTKGLEMVKTDTILGDMEAYKVFVSENQKSSSFIAINNIKIGYTGGRYRISVIVKSIKEGTNFGLRIQEVYPTRLDVVFDLKFNTPRDKFKKNDLTENEQIEIEVLEDEWFKCTLVADIYSSYFRLVFGPTTVGNNQTKVWEAESLNNSNREILIIPSSIVVEEITN